MAVNIISVHDITCHTEQLFFFKRTCNVVKKDCRLIDIALFHITIRHIDILIICICVRKIYPDAKKGSPGKSQNYPYREQPFRDISLCLKDEMSAYINDCKKQKDNCYLQ